MKDVTSTIERRSHFINRHGPAALLWLAFLLQGAKTPLTFFIWGSVALSLCAISLWAHSNRFSPHLHKKEMALWVCLAVSQAYSQEFSRSWLWTSEAFVFLLVWISFKANSDFDQGYDSFYLSLCLMAPLIMIKTLSQYGNYLSWVRSHGFFPLNPVFNATWMISVGIALLAHGLAMLQTNRRRAQTEMVMAILLFLTAVFGPVRSILPGLCVALLYVLHPFLNVRRVIMVLVLLTITALTIPKKIIYGRLRLGQENYRMAIWSIAGRASLDYPMHGWGLGTFEMPYLRYAFPVETDPIRFVRTTDFAHNEYLQVASEVGWGPFWLMIISVLALLGHSVQKSPQTQRPAKAALIVLFIIAATNIIWHLPILVYMTLVWSAMLLENSHRSPILSRKKSQSIRIFYLVLITLTQISLSWLALRQYWSERSQWDAILRWNRWDSLAWEKKGDQQTDWQMASLAYARAAQLAPSNLYFHEAFARSLEASNQTKFYPAALEEYRHALMNSPNRATDALAIGRILFKMGDPISAMEWFQRARRIEPRYWETDLWIARCWSAMGQPARAAWGLQFLRSRRRLVLLWQQRVIEDFPGGTDPTNYDQTILGYDDQIVEKELAANEGRLLRH